MAVCLSTQLRSSSLLVQVIGVVFACVMEAEAHSHKMHRQRYSLYTALTVSHA